LLRLFWLLLFMLLLLLFMLLLLLHLRSLAFFRLWLRLALWLCRFGLGPLTQPRRGLDRDGLLLE
jgi:hypothetical protein